MKKILSLLLALFLALSTTACGQKHPLDSSVESSAPKAQSSEDSIESSSEDSVPDADSVDINSEVSASETE